jgi:hypothetical protein
MRNWEYYLVVVAAGPRPIDRRRIRVLTTPTSTPSNTHARGLAKLKDLGTSPRPGAVCGAGILFDRGLADRGVSLSMTTERGGLGARKREFRRCFALASTSTRLRLA